MGGGNPHGGRPIVLLADRKHHCTTIRESGYTTYFYLNVFLSVPLSVRFSPFFFPSPLLDGLDPEEIFTPAHPIRIVTKLADFCERGKEPCQVPRFFFTERCRPPRGYEVILDRGG